MILGYQCDKCKAIHDQVNELVVYLSDESDILFTYWICDEHLQEVFIDMQNKFKDNIVVITGEKKTVDLFKVAKKEVKEVIESVKHISKMGRR